MGRKWTQIDDEMLLAMRMEGASTEQIARRLDRTEEGVLSREWKLTNLENGKLKESNKVRRNSNTLLPINGEKLRYLLRKNRIVQRTLAEEVGVSRKTVAYWLDTGYIPRMAMAGLTNLYGIKYEDIKPEPKEATKQEEKGTPTHHAQEVTLSNEDSAALYDLIFKAVYEGIKKALNE